VSLMEYLPPMQTQRQGADKYFGSVASGYDAKRMDDPKWTIEQRIIEDMLSDVPSGSWVLDIPCGTGRFFEFYHKKGFIFRGCDKSADMLAQAAKKVVDPHKARLQVANVCSLPFDDKSVDAALMIRLTRWLSPVDCQQAFRELQRVSRGRIILTARVANHPHARALELFTTILEPGWRLERNEAGVDLDYRILMFKRQA
jgi:ubiquinone/menaquinone biosynthesis C-methylase UbiE